MTSNKVTVAELQAMKKRGEKIPSLTAYDYAMTRLLDEAGVPLLLVGDSLGMVVLGYPDTTHVSLAEMEHHVRAAARARPRALLAADLPYHSYENAKTAVESSRRLVAAGAEAVKAEGGLAILDQVKAIIAEGIPFIGHLGMLPQHVLEEGGYHIKGRTADEREALLADAHALQTAGAFSIVLELVTPKVAREVTNTLSIPTIGIGSGPDCDGQILVTPDLIGAYPWFKPNFVKSQTNVAQEIQQAIDNWRRQI